MVCAWVFFALLSMASKAGMVPEALNFIPNAIIGGTLAGLTMGGVLTTMIFRYFRERNDNVKMTLALLGFAAFYNRVSIITRPYWKLAKLGATPAWLFLCSAFTSYRFCGTLLVVRRIQESKLVQFYQASRNRYASMLSHSLFPAIPCFGIKHTFARRDPYRRSGIIEIAES